MKKIICIFALCTAAVALGGCMGGTKCEVEPIVRENHKLIVPPNFGQMPK